MSGQVFVYGSLMRGLQYHHLLGDAPFLGEDTTRDPFRLISLGPYPAAVEGGGCPVRGEVYTVPEATLGRLDVLEGVPVHYERRRVSLQSGRQAWMYVMPLRATPGDEGSWEVVDDGDWRGFRT